MACISEIMLSWMAFISCIQLSKLPIIHTGSFSFSQCLYPLVRDITLGMKLTANLIHRYLFNQGFSLQDAVLLIPQWLVVKGKSKNPVLAHSRSLDISPGLLHVMEFQQVFCKATERIDFSQGEGKQAACNSLLPACPFICFQQNVCPNLGCVSQPPNLY